MDSKIFYFLWITIALLAIDANGQADTVFLKNGSFEDNPRIGMGKYNEGKFTKPPKGWYDCQMKEFPGQSPPDIHPAGGWGVTKLAHHGETYLGMVIRATATWESISQRLSKPLKKGQCYSFSIVLARSKYYLSQSASTGRESNFTKPAVLQIWGGNGHCGHQQLLAESERVTNHDWVKFEFEIKPSSDLRYITLQCADDGLALFSYDGHLLLDDASSFVRIPCDGEPPFEVEEKEEIIARVQPKKTSQETDKKESSSSQPIAEAEIPVRKQKLLTELVSSKIHEGKTIRIEQLTFPANSAQLRYESYPVLDEIYDFLKENRGVLVEVQGHTNGNPGIKHSFCDSLSDLRAKTVAEYLVTKGIAPRRISSKGYGKRKPIASNFTIAGRKRNQRVEIKILSTKGIEG